MKPKPGDGHATIHNPSLHPSIFREMNRLGLKGEPAPQPHVPHVMMHVMTFPCLCLHGAPSHLIITAFVSYTGSCSYAFWHNILLSLSQLGKQWQI